MMKVQSLTVSIVLLLTVVFVERSALQDQLKQGEWIIRIVSGEQPAAAASLFGTKIWGDRL